MADTIQYSPWNSPGQNTGVGSLSLLQGIFPTQGSNPGFPRCRQILYQLSHKGSPGIQGKPKNTGVGSLSLLQWIFLTQELNWGLLRCRQILYQQSKLESPIDHIVLETSRSGRLRNAACRGQPPANAEQSGVQVKKLPRETTHSSLLIKTQAPQTHFHISIAPCFTAPSPTVYPYTSACLCQPLHCASWSLHFVRSASSPNSLLL